MSKKKIVTAAYPGLPDEGKDKKIGTICLSYDGELHGSGCDFSERDVGYVVPASRARACAAALRHAGFKVYVEEDDEEDDIERGQNLINQGCEEIEEAAAIIRRGKERLRAQIRAAHPDWADGRVEEEVSARVRGK
jgi:hypothetical protein